MPVESDPPGLNLVVLPMYFRQIDLIPASVYLALLLPTFIPSASLIPPPPRNNAILSARQERSVPPDTSVCKKHWEILPAP